MENSKKSAGEKHSRTILKAISWRLFGSITTFGVTFFMTDSINIATTVSAIELLSKIFLFYLHERVWIKINNAIS
jgi:uncharacterized membrane protein